MSTRKPSDTGHAVLALVELAQPVTPYQLKQIAQESIFHFWAIPHTQIYTECTRLADAGLLLEEREEAGRRRRVYRLSAAGRKALEAWRRDPETDLYELRDPGLLKLFCGADPAGVAAMQLPKHEARLARYRELMSDELPDGVRLALESGIGHEKEYIRFWTRLRAL